MKTPIALLSALLMALALPAAGEALYHVELIVFVPTGVDAAGTEESWPRPQGLGYPDHWWRLDDLEATNPEDHDEPDAEEPAPPLAEPAPWHSLPRDRWALRDSASRLQRSGRYQVLVHQAWQQPLDAPGEPPALVLEGGERFGDYYRLQGHLSLSQQRIIMAELELWLSEFRLDGSQHTQLFSPLPRPPRHVAEIDWSPWPTEAENAPLAGLTHSTTVDYVPSQVITLRQQQRIEPRRLIYFDHPLMGALLWLEPIEDDPDTP